MISSDLTYLANYVACFEHNGMCPETVAKLTERLRDLASDMQQMECMTVPAHLLPRRIVAIQPQLTLHQGGLGDE